MYIMCILYSMYIAKYVRRYRRDTTDAISVQPKIFKNEFNYASYVANCFFKKILENKN